MADWRKLAMAAILADGQIDENEVKVLKKELYADKRVTHEEVQFLIELRAQAQKKAKGAELHASFENFFFKALQDSVLDNDYISPEEVKILEQAILGDKKVDANEQKFMQKLKKAAGRTCPEFEALYLKCMPKGK